MLSSSQFLGTGPGTGGPLAFAYPTTRLLIGTMATWMLRKSP